MELLYGGFSIAWEWLQRNSTTYLKEICKDGLRNENLRNTPLVKLEKKGILSFLLILVNTIEKKIRNDMKNKTAI